MRDCLHATSRLPFFRCAFATGAATAYLLCAAVAGATPGMNTQTPLPHSLYMADIDGDGLSELVQFSGNRIFVSGTDEAYTGKFHFYLPNVASQLLIGDFSGNGTNQICASLQDGSLSCYAPSPDGTTLWFWFNQTDFTGGQQLMVGDLDGNGTDDLLVYDPTSGGLSAYTYNGSRFGSISSFSLGNLASAQGANMRFRLVESGGKAAGVAAIYPNGSVSWFFALNDGTNNTFWYAFNTVGGFVPSGADVTTAKIDDDTTDDLVVHTSSGVYSFYHFAQSGGGMQAITNVQTRQLDASANATVHWGRMMPNLSEPGGATRDDALVYTANNKFIRSDARWDGSQYTYWWTFTGGMPANDSWPAVAFDKWFVLLCGYQDAPTFPALPGGLKPVAFFQQLFTSAGAGAGGMYDYMRDISYGTLDIGSSEVDGVYVEPINSATDNGGSASQLQNCVNASGIATTGHKVLSASTVQNGTQNIGVGSGVKVDTCGMFPGVLGQEVLHSYGVWHAFNTNRDGTLPSCGGSPGEYCDPWDVMSAKSSYMYSNSRFPGCGTGFGNPGSGPNVNMAYKDVSGWIPNARKWAVNSGSGNQSSPVTIASSGHPEANGALMAKINLPTPGTFFAVEYRTRDGWDQAIPRPAVFVHYYDNSQNPFPIAKSWLQWDAAGNEDMQPGDKFTAPGGLSVTVNSFNSDNTATVAITY
jgi:hypothetical protein